MLDFHMKNKTNYIFFLIAFLFGPFTFDVGLVFFNYCNGLMESAGNSNQRNGRTDPGVKWSTGPGTFDKSFTLTKVLL